jgi:hypothetical protein
LILARHLYTHFREKPFNVCLKSFSLIIYTGVVINQENVVLGQNHSLRIHAWLNIYIHTLCRNQVQVLQNRAARTITGADRHTRITQLHEMLNLDTLETRIK